MYQWLVPSMPLAWAARRTVDDVDLVISSSHACAKSVRIADGIPHLCYCHTPMRYAWQFAAERERFPRALRPVAQAGMAWFRRWDRQSARHVTCFVANSSAVARRIESSFGRAAEVIHPPVDTVFFTPGGERAGFFLYVGRLVSYKRPDLVVEAFAELPELELLVVGEGPMRLSLETAATANVTFLGGVGDQQLRDLYRTARALVYPAEEDFGITMAEAIACGTPVIGLSQGGATDIVEPGVTGRLIGSQSVTELRAAIRETVSDEVDAFAIAARAQRFSVERFRREIRAAAESCAGGRSLAGSRRTSPGRARFVSAPPSRRSSSCSSSTSRCSCSMSSAARRCSTRTSGVKRL
jgi:glycosyltransferase involved in cell wall biosynthesis